MVLLGEFYDTQQKIILFFRRNIELQLVFFRISKQQDVQARAAC